MAKVVLQPGQPIEDAINKFTRQVRKSGVLNSVRQREYFVKPGAAKRLKRKEAQKNRSKSKKFY